MQTRCPSCETIFNFTEKQAMIASGMVQCGVCNRFFNSMNNRIDEEPAIDAEADVKPKVKPSRNGGVISATDSGSQEMPAMLAEGYVQARPAVPWWSTALWSMLIVLAMVAGLAQMAWFNVQNLAADPSLKPLVEQACQYVPCRLERQRDLQKFELLSRDVRNHPTRPGALLITAAFINRAEFAQPYPTVSLVLSNLTGETVAYRYFKPSDYLEEEQGSSEMMPSNVPATLVMEVHDPGQESVSYHFEFF